MTTTILNRRETAEAGRPADLREGLGEERLLTIALDAVQSLDASKLNAAVSGAQSVRPQMMLTLLAYCYAGRLYGSREIASAIRTDQTVRYICARAVLDWRDIRQFRRNNRELVEGCVAYVLEKAWLLKRTELRGELIPEHSTLPELNGDFALAARQKIDVAIIMDMPESD